MNNDIERQSFWNEEIDEFLRKRIEQNRAFIQRWDSTVNKIPFDISGGIEPIFQDTYVRRTIKTLGVNKD